ncbi:hypothetical protein BB559_006336 [Furculomyces boomerangus]|uniref:U3 small nucleolar RNA-associated protein 13 C-terminal domain-containing protein n=2 Tax=Harpellales TaxID=61421 RepID=A0A2T9Y3H8_9FUNG|nr:hypothetical protein BB559_006336 [Furculomyces boomerangus]PVZ96475.1 hypothetical protein BB558_007650 [Smittium angustum]PWA03326.1 hypothetical protein BB558_000507 [Smittium angustum]
MDIQTKNCFEKFREIESIYTNGKVALSGNTIFTTFNEDIHAIQYGSGEIEFTIKGDTDIITSFAVSPNTKFLVSASRSLMISIVDLETKSTIKKFKGHQAPIISMEFDESSTLFATGAADGSLMVWDAQRGYCTHNLRGNRGVVTALKFFSEANGTTKLASGAEDGSVRLYNLNTNQCEAVLNGHVSVIREISFSGDNKYIISGGRDSVINLWDTKTKKLVLTIPVYEGVESVGTMIIGNEQVIYMGGEKGKPRFFDISGKEIQFQFKINNQMITQLIYSKIHNQLIMVTSDQNIEALEVSHENNTINTAWQVVGNNDEIIDLQFVGLNQTHLAVATNSELLRIYDTDTLRCQLVDGHKDIVLSIDAHPKYFATSSKDYTARVWTFSPQSNTNSIPSVTTVGIATGHTGSVGAVKLAKDDDCTFMVTGGQDRTIKLWDLTTLEESKTLKTRFTVKAHDKDINSIAISPNNKLIASASQDRTIKTWSVSNGQLQNVFVGHKRGVWSVEFSSVDMVLASSSGDTTIKVWSVVDGTCLKTLEGHTGSPLRTTFISCGLQLLSSGSDGLIKVWNLKSGECDVTLDEHEDKVWATAITKNESIFVSGGSDSKIKFWKDTTKQEMDKLHKKQADNLLMGQALENYLAVKDYKNSISLALSLDKPHSILNMLMESIRTNNGLTEETFLGSVDIDNVFGSLTKDQLTRVLNYAREWNTNAKLSFVAQAVISCIFHYYSHKQLLQIPGIRQLVASLIPYTERHLSRMDRLLTDTFMLDYALHGLDNLVEE